jgi:hypothetical protein
MSYGMEMRGPETLDKHHKEYTEGGAARSLGKPPVPPFTDKKSPEYKAWMQGYNDILNNKPLPK